MCECVFFSGALLFVFLFDLVQNISCKILTRIFLFKYQKNTKKKQLFF